jgi:hypothetical protein
MTTCDRRPTHQVTGFNRGARIVLLDLAQFLYNANALMPENDGERHGARRTRGQVHIAPANTPDHDTDESAARFRIDDRNFPRFNAIWLDENRRSACAHKYSPKAAAFRRAPNLRA